MLTPNIDLKNKSILVTGAAGFIGANLVTELLKDTDAVKIVGLDSMSDYYDVSIKEYRLAEIDKMAKQKNDSQWIFVKVTSKGKQTTSPRGRSTATVLFLLETSIPTAFIESLLY